MSQQSSLGPSKEIFLSYGREQEVQAFVLRLKHDLEKNGFSVWLDLEDIPAGKFSQIAKVIYIIMLA
jgi:hypothetical protein